MPKNSAIEVAYNHKIKEAVDMFYSLTLNRTINFGIRRFRHSNIMMDTGLALLDMGIIVNQGNPSHPKYQWADRRISPDDDLYVKVRTRIAERNREEHRFEPLVFPFEKTQETQTPFISAPASELNLSSVSDAELWAELKMRGYSIENNKLIKTL